MAREAALQGAKADGALFPILLLDAADIVRSLRDDVNKSILHVHSHVPYEGSQEPARLWDPYVYVVFRALGKRTYSE